MAQEHQPVMIHRGVVRTMERMVTYLIEMYGGDFPLAPAQAVVIPIRPPRGLRPGGGETAIRSRLPRAGRRQRQAYERQDPRGEIAEGSVSASSRLPPLFVRRLLGALS